MKFGMCILFQQGNGYRMSFGARVIARPGNACHFPRFSSPTSQSTGNSGNTKRAQLMSIQFPARKVSRVFTRKSKVWQKNEI